MKHLGKFEPLQHNPSKDILDVFPNPEMNQPYDVTFETDEFTSLCPITGQPDWARVYIRYRPTKVCLETKSLKLYLQAFRMYNGFMEAIASKIFKDLSEVLEPSEMDVQMIFKARGGIHPQVSLRMPTEEPKE